MENQNPKSIFPVLLAVIMTSIVVGGGVYWWQSSKPETEPISSEIQETDYALSVNQDASGASIITLRDTFNEGAGFSLHFPSSWGFVNVKKTNLTDCGFDCDPPQRASYMFTSEFRANHYVDVIISYANEKDSSLVTQGNRIFIAEDDTYYYNYSPSTEYCVEEGKCTEDEVEGINAEIQEIINSFEFLQD